MIKPTDYALAVRIRARLLDLYKHRCDVKLTDAVILLFVQITMAYVNDVIASCAFGFAVNSLEDPSNCIFKLGKKAIVQDTTQVMKFFGYENMKSVMKVTYRIFDGLIFNLCVDNDNDFSLRRNHATSPERMDMGESKQKPYRPLSIGIILFQLFS